MYLVSERPMKIRNDGRYEYDHVLAPEQMLIPIWEYFFPKDRIARVTVEGPDVIQTDNYPIVFDKFNEGYRVSGVRIKNNFVGSNFTEFIVMNVFMEKSKLDYNEADANIVMKIMELGSAAKDNQIKWGQSK